MENINISLPAQGWNIILNALGQRPFIEVQELIAEIKRQGDAATAPVADAETDEKGHA